MRDLASTSQADFLVAEKQVLFFCYCFVHLSQSQSLNVKHLGVSKDGLFVPHCSRSLGVRQHAARIATVTINLK